MPVWNIGRPSSGWMRGPKGAVSPPDTGCMKRGRPRIGAAMASAVAGARLIEGNMKRPPPIPAVKAEPAGAVVAASVTSVTSVTSSVESSARARSTASTASCTAVDDPAASTTDATGAAGPVPPRKGSSTKSTKMAAKGTKRPLTRMLRTRGAVHSPASATVNSAPLEPLLVSPSTLLAKVSPDTGARTDSCLDAPVASTIGRWFCGAGRSGKTRRDRCGNLAQTPAFRDCRSCSPRGTVVSAGEEDRPGSGGQVGVEPVGDDRGGNLPGESAEPPRPAAPSPWAARKDCGPAPTGAGRP